MWQIPPVVVPPTDTVIRPLPSRRSPDPAHPIPQTQNCTLERSGPAQPIRNSCASGCCYTACSQRGPESQVCSNCFLTSKRAAREAVCALGLEFVWVVTSETLVDSYIWVQSPDSQLQRSELTDAPAPNGICAFPKSGPFCITRCFPQISKLYPHDRAMIEP